MQTAANWQAKIDINTGHVYTYSSYTQIFYGSSGGAIVFLFQINSTPIIMKNPGDQTNQAFQKVKIIGHRLVQPTAHASPIEFHRRALALQARLERLNPFHSPRGFVFKAKTREDYEAWKRQQTNPRLW